jgi:uncharacterized protein (DUF2147 family)
MMANQLLVSFLALMLYTGTTKNITTVAASDQICGRWQNEDKNLIVQIYRESNEFKAKIVWFDNGEGEESMNRRTDIHNPNPALRNRKIIGINVLEDLEYDPQSQSWEDGIIYDASNGRQWSSSAKMNKDGSLKVKGYWKYKFIGKSITFRRVQ